MKTGRYKKKEVSKMILFTVIWVLIVFVMLFTLVAELFDFEA